MSALDYLESALLLKSIVEVPLIYEDSRLKEPFMFGQCISLDIVAPDSCQLSWNTEIPLPIDATSIGVIGENNGQIETMLLTIPANTNYSVLPKDGYQILTTNQGFGGQSVNTSVPLDFINTGPITTQMGIVLLENGTRFNPTMPPTNFACNNITTVKKPSGPQLITPSVRTNPANRPNSVPIKSGPQTTPQTITNANRATTAASRQGARNTATNSQRELVSSEILSRLEDAGTVTIDRTKEPRRVQFQLDPTRSYPDLQNKILNRDVFSEGRFTQGLIPLNFNQPLTIAKAGALYTVTQGTTSNAAGFVQMSQAIDLYLGKI